MKILGKRKNNYILEVTPYEVEVIKTSLMEWQSIEGDTSKPDNAFGKVLSRIFKAESKFKQLPIFQKYKELE